MIEELLERTGSAAEPGGDVVGRLLVAVDPDRDPDALIGWALAIAPAMKREVRLIERLAAGVTHGGPVDPVDLDLQRRVLDAHLAGIAASHRHRDAHVSRRVYEHLLVASVGENGDASPIIALQRRDGRLPWLADSETRRFVEERCEAVLVVPESVTVRAPSALRRVLAPLDGSARAEHALPTALAIARRHRAELVLLHAACPTSLLAPEPPDAESLELAERVRDRNRRVADAYLDRLKAERAEAGLTLSTRVLLGGDPRHRLVDALSDSDAELIVLASHGESGHVDVATGSVAHFVLEHARAPVLMMSSQQDIGVNPSRPSDADGSQRRAMAVPEPH